ncbi:hypothetical protein Ccrd_017012 [Cynara cardunculus var. scolymus]|uniref:Membrane-associated kinase regulator 6 n=1 Tax=Cynara cardunculus var. scolymus TaxID=59895 RepID=A0A103Y8W8_CYNCS|nr:hypothetical protein Ccrd_017012 [Cynara cardunculus var. scolymus]
MEVSESLSIESFSYSWLVNLKPSFESPKGSFRFSFDESNFIEMDPKLSASKRFLVFHQDFDFDLPTLQPSVHADELISNGFLVPLFLKPLDVGSNSTPASPVSSSAVQENVCSYRRSRSLSFRRYKRLPKRVVQKYLNLVRLIWLRMRRGRCDSSDLQRTKNWEFSGTGKTTFSSESYPVDNWRRSCDSETTKIWGFAGPSSPRTNEAYSSDNWPQSCEVYAADNWRRSCDSENSIYEAVLHCKKTIGMRKP